MKKRFIAFLFLCLLSVAAFAAGVDSTGYNIGHVNIKAGFSFGFNYDMLRAPTDVSFEYSKGYFGLNIPYKQSFDKTLVDNVLSNPDIISDTSYGSRITPKVSAGQNANYTVRVDVPMMGGVASFSNIQNFYMYYMTSLGDPGLVVAPESLGSGLGLFMRGAVHVPINLSMGWETMSLGYAYRVNRDLKLAMSLSRHIFLLDAQAQINIDIKGYLNINNEQLNLEVPVDYPSTRVNGVAMAHYQAEAWAPAIGVEFWRLTWTSRFGLATQASGTLNATYRLPFFIDPQTFEIKLDTKNTEELMSAETRGKFMSGATDSLTWSCSNKLKWKLPQGHTLSFDLIRGKLNVSYTKLFGDIEMNLGNIVMERKTVDSLGAPIVNTDTVALDYGLTIDNVIMLSGTFHNAFFNLGVFTMDMRWADKSNLLENAIPIDQLKMGGGMLLPVFNLGTALGSKLQLLLELDLLPLLAVKSGVIYYF